MSTAHAEIPDCKVGDLSKGWWQRIAFPHPGECPFPGPPAEDSLWPGVNVNPGSPSAIAMAYRIEGRYKIVVSMSADGWSRSIPPERDECITGYAVAYAAWACERHQKTCDEVGQCYTTFTASSTLGTMKTSYANRISIQYARYSDVPILLYEWVCNPPQTTDPKANQGPPACPVP